MNWLVRVSVNAFRFWCNVEAAISQTIQAEGLSLWAVIKLIWQPHRVFRVRSKHPNDSRPSCGSCGPQRRGAPTEGFSYLRPPGAFRFLATQVVGAPRERGRV